MKKFFVTRPLQLLTESEDENLTLHPQHGTQYGSNDGGIHHDGQGNKYYVKNYRNTDQAKSEELAGKIYNHLGVQTPGAKVATVNGKTALVTRWNDNYKRMKPHEFENLSQEHHDQLGRMYHAAVLTKNWDVAGLDHDNIVHDKSTGNMVQVDTGGTFKFRAQGGPKDYGPDIGEHKTLRDPGMNPQTHHVFSNVFGKSPESFERGKEAVRNLPMDKIHEDFKNSGLSNWQELHQNFVARREKLLNAKL